MDLQDREHNTKDGLHIASLAGAWTALVGGFGGARAGTDGLSFWPRLPPGLAGLTFRMRYRGRVIRVHVRHHEATYELISGDPLPVSYHGHPLTIGTEKVTREISRPEPLPSPAQPPGRTPQPRRERSASGS